MIYCISFGEGIRHATCRLRHFYQKQLAIPRRRDYIIIVPALHIHQPLATREQFIMIRELHRNEPLLWPVDWDGLTENQRFFRDFPFFGTNAVVKYILDKWMKNRTDDILCLWPDNQKVKYVRDIVTRVLADSGFWVNPLFHPDDPCEIVFWTPSGPVDYMELEACFWKLQQRFSLPEDFFDDWNTLSLLQFVDKIVRTAKMLVIY